MSHPVEVVVIFMAIALPAIIIAYLAKKHRSVVKPVGAIVAMTGATVIIMLFVFGFVSTDTYMTSQQGEVEEPTKEVAPAESIFAIQILKDSFQKGNPDYEPDVAVVSQGYTVEWTNTESVTHTVTSKKGWGKIFDSGLMDAGDVFMLDTSNLAVGEYEYLCVAHPWMVATLVIEEPKEGD